MAWMSSPAYQDIAKHGLEASVGNAIMVKKLADGEMEQRLTENA